MPKPRFSLNESLWVCGGARCQEILYPRVEVAALRARGAEVFLFNGQKDTRGLAELRQRLQQSDIHVVLMWLRPAEMNALRPLLRERKNFSVAIDDWWITPSWLMRDADYIINRMYNGVATRLGESELVTTEPPLFGKPQVISPYALAAAALRLPALAAWLMPFAGCKGKTKASARSGCCICRFPSCPMRCRSRTKRSGMI
jgi:hypothetical protein